MDDLAAWLTQIWDEREKAARDALDTSNVHIPTASGYVVEYVWMRQLLLDGALHSGWTMPGPSPTEVLARIAADRQILALATKTIADAPVRGYDWDSEYVLAQAVAYEQVIRLLALPYADRPGYQEAWKPE